MGRCRPTHGADRSGPACRRGQILVRVTRVGICGSDLAILRGQHARARPGTVIGHEFVGTVAATRAAAGPGRHPGRRTPLIACADRGTEPACRACASGNAHVCAGLGLYGVDEPGGLAEYVAVRAAAVHPVRPRSHRGSPPSPSRSPSPCTRSPAPDWPEANAS
ncbi:alcohol dehydrogenase catalytic domain-containing protein [Streptomyces sp. M19]